MVKSLTWAPHRDVRRNWHSKKREGKENNRCKNPPLPPPSCCCDSHHTTGWMYGQARVWEWFARGQAQHLCVVISILISWRAGTGIPSIPPVHISIVVDVRSHLWVSVGWHIRVPQGHYPCSWCNDPRSPQTWESSWILPALNLPHFVELALLANWRVSQATLPGGQVRVTPLNSHPLSPACSAAPVNRGTPGGFLDSPVAPLFFTFWNLSSCFIYSVRDCDSVTCGTFSPLVWLSSGIP